MPGAFCSVAGVNAGEARGVFRRSDDKDYYAILQVDSKAEPEVIEAAYFRLSRKYHPDDSGNPATGHRMGDINEAYRVLSDPAKRRAYDLRRSLRFSPGWSPRGDRAEDWFRSILPYIGLALVALLAIRLLPLFIRPPLLLALAVAVAAGILFFKVRRR